jgi:hypothetical protein
MKITNPTEIAKVLTENVSINNGLILETTQQFYHGSHQVLKIGQIIQGSSEIRQQNFLRHTKDLEPLERFFEEIRSKEFQKMPSRMMAIFLDDKPGFGKYKFSVIPLGKVYGPFDFNLITKSYNPSSALWFDHGIKSIYEYNVDNAYALTSLKAQIRKYWRGGNQIRNKEYITTDPIKIVSEV